jgi:hypothetical protein
LISFRFRPSTIASALACASCDFPIHVRLLPRRSLAAGLERGFCSVQPSTRSLERFLTPLDRFKAVSQVVVSVEASMSAVLLKTFFPGVEVVLALIRDTFALVGGALPFVGCLLALVGYPVALIGYPVTLVSIRFEPGRLVVVRTGWRLFAGQVHTYNLRPAAASNRGARCQLGR